MHVNEALKTAAAAVRKELIRFDYVEGDVGPDGEDYAIAAAAIKAFLNAVNSDIVNTVEFALPAG